MAIPERDREAARRVANDARAARARTWQRAVERRQTAAAAGHGREPGDDKAGRTDESDPGDVDDDEPEPAPGRLLH